MLTPPVILRRAAWPDFWDKDGRDNDKCKKNEQAESSR
jgi:hypothetical protein